jgi:flagellar biosynthesis protein FlgN
MSPFLPNLQAQRSCIDALLRALQEEDEALAAGRFDELPELTGRKSALLARVADLEQHRESLQAQFGLPPGRTGAELASSADEALRESWTALLATAHRARELNRRVGAKVYTNLDFTRQALAFLQARVQPLYGRDGATRQPLGHTRLALG